MTVATFPRVTTIPEDMEVLDRDLAVRAEHELGYGAIGAVIAARQAKRELYAKLIALGVPPIDEAAVQRYKRRVVQKTWLVPMGIQIGLGLGIVAAVFAGRQLHITGYVGIGAAAFVVSTLAAIFGSAAMWTLIAPASWEWQEIRLEGYRQPVPEHILATALLVGGVIPQTSSDWGDNRFLVEEYRKQYQPDVADPFLIVQHNGAKAYIAVWDEPSFKG